MIFSTKLHSLLFKSINNCLLLSFQSKYPYGNINKPSNYFSSKNSKNDSPINIQANQTYNKKLIKQPTQQDININHPKISNNDVIQQRQVKYKGRVHKEFVEQFFQNQTQGKLQIIQKYKEQDNLKNLAIICKQMNIRGQRSDILWATMEQILVQRLKPVQDQEYIRYISSMIYALCKSKKATRNYQTGIALLLPFSSIKSFTEIITSMSRMGGLSEQFCHIIQKLYWKRKQQFGALQQNLINYTLVKNGKKIDPSLIQHLNSYPLRQICLMMKSYDKSNQMTPQILKKCIPAILARRKENTYFDLKHLITIYTKHMYLDDPRIVKFFDQQYRSIAHLVDQHVLQDIWEYILPAINANKLPISLMQSMMKTIKILKSRRKICDRIWKKISSTFDKFQNLQIRTKLQKIY